MTALARSHLACLRPRKMPELPRIRPPQQDDTASTPTVALADRQQPTSATLSSSLLNRTDLSVMLARSTLLAANARQAPSGTPSDGRRP